MENVLDIIEKFREVFEYIDGQIYWKITKGSRAKKGNKAGKLRKDGYYDVGLDGKYYLVHRVIFALIHGYLPEVVDHIDRNPKNNLIVNLRPATYTNNSWNSGISANNSTGVKGVRKTTRNNKYEARIAANNQTYQVGTFDSLEEAELAIQNFRIEKHTDYACHG